MLQITFPALKDEFLEKFLELWIKDDKSDISSAYVAALTYHVSKTTNPELKKTEVATAVKTTTTAMQPHIKDIAERQGLPISYNTKDSGLDFVAAPTETIEQKT